LFSIIGGENQSMTDNIQFDFGQNWDEFSKNSLTPEKVQQASFELFRTGGWYRPGK
jgi:hypothetical protein